LKISKEDFRRLSKSEKRVLNEEENGDKSQQRFNFEASTSFGFSLTSSKHIEMKA